MRGTTKKTGLGVGFGRVASAFLDIFLGAWVVAGLCHFPHCEGMMLTLIE